MEPNVDQGGPNSSSDSDKGSSTEESDLGAHEPFLGGLSWNTEERTMVLARFMRMLEIFTTHNAETIGLGRAEVIGEAVEAAGIRILRQLLLRPPTWRLQDPRRPPAWYGRPVPMMETRSRTSRQSRLSNAAYPSPLYI